MPQQPKVTGDAQVDSWSLEVTNELNSIPFRIAERDVGSDVLNIYNTENGGIGFYTGYFMESRAEQIRIRTNGDTEILRGDLEVLQGNASVDQGTLSVHGDTSILEGNLDVNQGNVTVGEGNVTVSEGNVAVSEGDLTVNGDADIETGSLTVSAGNILVDAGHIYQRPVGDDATDWSLPVSFQRTYPGLTNGQWYDVARVDARCAYELVYTNIGGAFSPRSWIAHVQLGWSTTTSDANRISDLRGATGIFDAIRIRGFDGRGVQEGTPVIQVRAATTRTETDQTYQFMVRPLTCGQAYRDTLADLNADTSTSFSGEHVIS